MNKITATFGDGEKIQADIEIRKSDDVTVHFNNRKFDCEFDDEPDWFVTENGKAVIDSSLIDDITDVIDFAFVAGLDVERTKSVKKDRTWKFPTSVKVTVE